MAGQKNRIGLGGSGWTIDEREVRDGDDVEVWVGGGWRRAVVRFKQNIPVIVQRFGPAQRDVMIGVPPDDLPIRWPGDVPPVRGLPN